MSFVQEFLQENLNKGLSHQVLNKIQQCNSSTEDLVGNLSNLRQIPKLTAYRMRIKYIENYLSVKAQIFEALQPHSSINIVMEWLESSIGQIGTGQNSILLLELIKKQEIFIKKQIIDIAKRTVLHEGAQQSYFQQNIDSKILLQKLHELEGQIDGKSEQQPQSSSRHILTSYSRNKVLQIDQLMAIFITRIHTFHQKVNLFNLQMKILFERILSFQRQMLSEFSNSISGIDEQAYQQHQQSILQQQRRLTSFQHQPQPHVDVYLSQSRQSLQSLLHTNNNNNSPSIIKNRRANNDNTNIDRNNVLNKVNSYSNFRQPYSHSRQNSLVSRGEEPLSSYYQKSLKINSRNNLNSNSNYNRSSSAVKYYKNGENQEYVATTTTPRNNLSISGGAGEGLPINTGVSFYDKKRRENSSYRNETNNSKDDYQRSYYPEFYQGLRHHNHNSRYRPRRQTTKNYDDILMSKTSTSKLSPFIHPSTSSSVLRDQMLYTQGFGGKEIRVPSNWGNSSRNSRSMISYNHHMR